MGSSAEPPGLALRPAEPGDRAFLHRVYAASRAEEMALVDWSEADKAAFLRIQFEAQDKHYRERFGAARFDVVEHDGVPIGRLYVDRRAGEIRIIDIALLPEHRGRGLGSALLTALLAEARERRLPVRIHVEHDSPALRLYHRLGFQKVEDQGVYWLMEFRPTEQEESAAQAPIRSVGRQIR